MLKIRRFLEYGKCSFCGKEELSFHLEKFNKKEYICSECRKCKSYTLKNNNIKGKPSSISFSFEFETSSRNKSLYELVKYKFIGCADRTIEGFEWKSPIFFSKKSFHTICRKIDKFSRFVGDSCGTHLHVSTSYKNLMEEYKHELFGPILDVMIFNTEKTKLFWGRYFNNYCMSDISNSRYNAFNTKSSVETLEFRLLKFKNAEQYIKASDFCIDTTKFINSLIGREGFKREDARLVGLTIAEKYKEVIKNV